MQMMVIIVAGTLGGKYLDQYLNLNFPVFTLIGVLLSLAIALYTVLKGLLNK